MGRGNDALGGYSFITSLVNRVDNSWKFMCPDPCSFT